MPFRIKGNILFYTQLVCSVYNYAALIGLPNHVSENCGTRNISAKVEMNRISEQRETSEIIQYQEGMKVSTEMLLRTVKIHTFREPLAVQS